MDGLVGLLGFAQTHASPARQAVIFITTATQHKFNFVLHHRVGGALQSPSSHTTVQALLHTAVPTKCLTTIPIAFSG
jgi:hypothetical protein